MLHAGASLAMGGGPTTEVQYLMDETAWSGSGSVTDSGGYGRNGSPIGRAQTTANGKVCRGGSIPANQSHETIDAIDTGLDISNLSPKKGTVSFWYYGNSAWNGGGSDVQLLDATTTSGAWFYLARQQGNGRLHFVVTNESGTVYTASTGNNSFAAANWHYISVTWSLGNLFGGNRIKIFIDGVEQASTATVGSSQLHSGINTLYLGDNRSGFIGGNGTGDSANGIIDEVRIYGGSERTAAQITADMNASHSCPVSATLHHLEISTASATGLSCSPATLMITACQDGPCNTLYTGNVQVTLTPTGWAGGDTFTFSGGTVTKNWNPPSTGILSFGAHSVSPAVSQSAICSVGGNSTCNIVVSSCPVRFNACEASPPLGSRCSPLSFGYDRLYTRLVGAGSKLDFVALSAGGALDSGFTGTVTVTLIANENSGVPLASNNCPTAQAGTINIGSVSFANGRPTAATGTDVAAFGRAYKDVRAQVSCPASVCGTTITSCSVDNFAVRPSSFLMVSSNALADASGGSTTAMPVFKAGNGNFTIIAAAGDGYNGTPQLDGNQIAAHSGAVRSGTIAGGFSAADPVSGQASGSFTYDEVGYLRLNEYAIFDESFTAVDQSGDCSNDFSNTAVDGKYGCKFGNLSPSSYFGRFVPDRFVVLTPVSFSPACGSGTSGFSYMDQPFTLSAIVEARNATHGKTRNYTGGFAKGVIDVQMENANNGTPIADNRLTRTGAWSEGTYAFNASKFTRLTNQPDGPYGSLSIGISVADEIGLATHLRPYLINRDMDATNTSCTADLAGTSSGSCTAVTLVTTKARFGRMRLRNAYGSELLPLPVPLTGESYHAVFGFAINTDDSCTPLAASDFSFANATGHMTVYASSPIVASPLASGIGSLKLTPPSVGGSIDLTMSAPVWLKYDWDGDGLFDDNPSARIAFGLHKSNLIDLRESY